MSADGEFEIICSRCQVPISGRIDSDGNETATCPSCGLTAPLEEAKREAVEYLADETFREGLEGVKSFKSSMVSITITEPEKRSFRFITRAKA